MKGLPIDYVTKDYEGFFQMMKDAIPLLAPEWTNTTDSDQGIVMLQQLAYGLHVLGYYEDKSVIEGFLETAKTRKAVLMNARYLGYEPYTQKAAVVTLEFTKRANLLGSDVTIPAGTQVSTDPKLGAAIVFETDTTLIIPAGQLTAIVTAKQGITIPDESLGTSTGKAGQEFVINYPSVLQDTLVIRTIENGATYNWTRADSFIDSAGNDRHFTASTDDDARMTITFGDGLNGAILPNAASLFASYRSGGGLIGNVGADKLVEIVDSTLTSVESVTNPASATGGDNEESIDSIRIRAPKAYRTRGRAVTPLDFEDFASSIPGIHAAKCVETFNPTSDVHLYVATSDGTPPTTALKNLVKSTIEAVMIMNQNLYVFDATYEDFAINVAITVRAGVSNAETKKTIEEAIAASYGPTSFVFGDTVFKAQLTNFMFQTDNRIINAVISDPATDVTTLATEIPRMTGYTVTVTGGV